LGRAAEHRHAPGLGEGICGTDHHLGRDAAEVGTLTTHQAAVDPDHRESGARELRGDVPAAGAVPDDDVIDLFSVSHVPSVAHPGESRTGQTRVLLLRWIAPSTPLTNAGDSSVDSSPTRPVASVTATASGTSSAQSSS